MRRGQILFTEQEAACGAPDVEEAFVNCVLLSSFLREEQVAVRLLTWSVPVGFCLAGIFHVAQSYVLTATLEPQELTLWCSSPPREPGNLLGIIANRWQSEDSNPEFCVYLGLTYCSDAGGCPLIRPRMRIFHWVWDPHLAPGKAGSPHPRLAAARGGQLRLPSG